jgi:hypothetical protein
MDAEKEDSYRVNLKSNLASSHRLWSEKLGRHGVRFRIRVCSFLAARSLEDASVHSEAGCQRIMSGEGHLDLRLLAERGGEADFRGVVSSYTTREVTSARPLHQPQLDLWLLAQRGGEAKVRGALRLKR